MSGVPSFGRQEQKHTLDQNKICWELNPITLSETRKPSLSRFDNLCRYVEMISPVSSQLMSSFFGSGLMSHCPLQNWKFYICSDATLTHRHTPSLQNKSLRGFLPRRISRDNLCINLILRSFLLPLLCGVFLRWVLLARDPVKSRAESS